MMSTAIGRLTSAVASGTIDTTIALASLNFDFSLYKVEAPKEFHGVGTVLSSARRTEAESGRAHVTARKLGALFELLLPPTPQLVKAYGLRASEISSSIAARDRGFSSYGVFANQIGADGTSIWAAATSSHSAIKLHLLACMLARIWDGPEAISIWVEIVNGRKLEIKSQFEQNNIGDLAANMAAQQELTRMQLAEWDASARAWLRAADMVKMKQQKQLELIIGNLRTDVNSKPSVYESVMQAWQVALEGMECLVSGMPQKMQTGEILLGLSAWHLFPDLIYIHSSMTTITQSDPLVQPGGVLTVGLHLSNHAGVSGVTWSLPLAHLRYYGTPVRTSRSIVEDGSRSRLSVNEFFQAVLGCVFGGWEKVGSDPGPAAKFIIQVCERFIQAALKDGHPHTLAIIRQSWLFILSESAKDFLASESLERQTYIRLINLGKKYYPFLGKPQKPLFGLSDYKTYFMLQRDTEQKIRVLRGMAHKANLESEDVFIRYCRSGPSDVNSYWNLVEYTTALPCVRSAVKRTSFQQEKPTSTHVRWIYRGIPEDIPGKSIYYSSSVPDENLFGGFCDEGNGSSAEYEPELETCPRLCGQTFTEDENARLREEFPSRVLKFSKLGEEISFIEHQDIKERMKKNDDDLTVFWHRPASRIQSVLVTNEEKSEATAAYKFFWGDIYTAALFIRCHNSNNNLDNKYLAENISSDSHPRNILEHQARKEDSAFKDDQTNKPVQNSKFRHSEKKLPALPRFTTLSEIQDFLAMETFEEKGFVQQVQMAISSLGNTYISSLRAIASVAKTYRLAPDATIHVQVLQTRLCESRWNCHHVLQDTSVDFSSAPMNYLLLNRRFGDSSYSFLDDQLRPISLDRMESFACMIMFESGKFDLPPDQLQNVMAMSAGDSIFVASALLCDPSEEPEFQEIQRVMGNIGRPGIALLVPPGAPEISSPNIGEWNLINHDQFDGNLQDCFQDTSLHLSFTGAELPLSVGNSGKQDIEVYILETIVSVHERGKWVADLDILTALESPSLARIRPFDDHHENAECRGRGFEHCHPLTSLRSWSEFLDRPEKDGVFCMHNNWQARLAATAIAINQSNTAIILPKDVCWGCVHAMAQKSESSPFTIIA